MVDRDNECGVNLFEFHYEVKVDSQILIFQCNMIMGWQNMTGSTM